MKKKILIFGATGNIGLYLIDYLIQNYNQNDYIIIACGRRKSPFFDKAGIIFYSIDISDEIQFSKLPTDDIYAVVLLASAMPGSMEGYFPEQYLRTNIIGAYNVLEYCRINTVKKIIYTQTIRDVGNYIGCKEPIKSDIIRSYSLKGDHAMYIISKNAACDMIEHYYLSYGIQRYILRLPTVYGYYRDQYYFVDGKKRIQGYRHLINQAINSLPIEIWGDPNNAHDVLYVKDLCSLVVKALNANNGGGVYNASTGIPVTLEDQIKGIIQVFSPPSKPSIIISCPTKPNARNYTLDISKAKSELGYSPQFNYLEYLTDFKKEFELQRFF